MLDPHHFHLFFFGTHSYIEKFLSALGSEILCAEKLCVRSYVNSVFGLLDCVSFFFLKKKILCDPTSENALDIIAHHFLAQKISGRALEIAHLSHLLL